MSRWAMSDLGGPVYRVPERVVSLVEGTPWDWDADAHLSRSSLALSPRPRVVVGVWSRGVPVSSAFEGSRLRWSGSSMPLEWDVPVWWPVESGASVVLMSGSPPMVAWPAVFAVMEDE